MPYVTAAMRSRLCMYNMMSRWRQQAFHGTLMLILYYHYMIRRCRYAGALAAGWRADYRFHIEAHALQSLPARAPRPGRVKAPRCNMKSADIAHMPMPMGHEAFGRQISYRLAVREYMLPCAACRRKATNYSTLVPVAFSCCAHALIEKMRRCR